MLDYTTAAGDRYKLFRRGVLGGIFCGETKIIPFVVIACMSPG